MKRLLKGVRRQKPRNFSGTTWYLHLFSHRSRQSFAPDFGESERPMPAVSFSCLSIGSNLTAKSLIYTYSSNKLLWENHLSVFSPFHPSTPPEGLRRRISPTLPNAHLFSECHTHVNHKEDTTAVLSLDRALSRRGSVKGASVPQAVWDNYIVLQCSRRGASAGHLSTLHESLILMQVADIGSHPGLLRALLTVCIC